MLILSNSTSSASLSASRHAVVAVTKIHSEDSASVRGHLLGHGHLLGAEAQHIRSEHGHGYCICVAHPLGVADQILVRAVVATHQVDDDASVRMSKASQMFKYPSNCVSFGCICLHELFFLGLVRLSCGRLSPAPARSRGVA